LFEWFIGFFLDINGFQDTCQIYKWHQLWIWGILCGTFEYAPRGGIAFIACGKLPQDAPDQYFLVPSHPFLSPFHLLLIWPDLPPRYLHLGYGLYTLALALGLHFIFHEYSPNWIGEKSLLDQDNQGVSVIYKRNC